MKVAHVLHAALAIAASVRATPLAASQSTDIDKRVSQVAVLIYKDANFENGEFLQLWSFICRKCI